MSKRKKRGRESWIRLFEEWLSSGSSQRCFCERRGISFSTFCYWRRRLRGEGEVRSQPSFIPVEIKPLHQSIRPSHYEVRLKDGVRIRVPSDFESESLSRLIDLFLGERC